MKETIIRRAEKRDAEEIINMMRDFYSSDAVMAPVPESRFERTIEHCLESDVYADLIVAELEGEILGYALTAKTFSNEAGGMVEWIEELYVAPAARGKGMGHKLLKELLSGDFARFRLEVERENTGAVKLYESFGFTFFDYDQMALQKRKD